MKNTLCALVLGLAISTTAVGCASSYERTLRIPQECEHVVSLVYSDGWNLTCRTAAGEEVFYHRLPSADFSASDRGHWIRYELQRE
ncbi:MAG TPA: hypothetical protein VJC21_00710 [Candidatus Nanoarchaeia archaeon]|nr:hypothetical protein [Candidatus Nanoarchaeia archaeon]